MRIRMLSWLYLLQGAGMMLVGVAAIAVWYLKKHVDVRYFLYGAVLWAAAIAVKVVMDFTITQPLNSFALSVPPIVVALSVMSLYFGLRTGILESGIAYIAVIKTKLSQATYDEAVALGLGFGGIEAILLGAYALYSTFLIVQPYEAIGLIPLFSFDPQALLAIPIPIVERAFVLACHVFATVLVVYAVWHAELKWLCASIIYKTVGDGALIPLKLYLGSMGLYGGWLIELFYGGMAIIALIGLWWLKKRYTGYTHGGSKVEKTGIPQ
jgi:hypothetical protein